MKKYLVGGLVLTTMFTGVACGSKKDDKVEESKPEQIVEVQDNQENKDDSKPVEDKKEEIEQTVNNSDKELDKKLAVVSSFLEKENLEGAKKAFSEINLEGLSDEGNKKYSDMSLRIKALEEKLAAKKEEEEKKEAAKEEVKKDRESILNGEKFIHIEYDNDKYDNYKIRKSEDGNLVVELKSDMIDLNGTLNKKSDNSWTGTLYNSEAGIDSFYDFVVTDDAIKITQSNDSNVRTLTLYLKSKTYKEDNTNPNAVREIKGSFTLR